MAIDFNNFIYGLGTSPALGGTLSHWLTDAGAPLGTSGATDTVGIGSFYTNQTTGAMYKKIADTSSASDWVELPALADLVLSAGFAAANGTVAIGDTYEEAIEFLAGNQIDLTTLSGVAQGAVDLGTFTGTTITDNSTIKAALQELETALEAVDVLSAGYAAANGTVAIGDTHEEAIEKLAGNQIDLTTLSGVAQGAVDLGTFTGTTISDNVTNKVALQELETALEAISGGSQVQVTGLTTLATVDSALVDVAQSCEWEIVVWEDATPANKKMFRVEAFHDGVDGGADASNVKHIVSKEVRLGSNFNLVVDVDLNGAAGAQEMRLRASSSTAGVTITARKACVNF